MKTAFIDHQHLAKQFNKGDTVIFTMGNAYAPTLGHITAVLPHIGFLDVETPFGNIRVCPTDVVKNNNIDSSYLEDTSEQTWERLRASKIASYYFEITFKEMVKEATILRMEGLNEFQTYNSMYHSRQASVGESTIKDAVSFVFKKALYWRDVGRQYAPSKQEKECGVYSCPKCKCQMKRTCYKKFTRLLACPECLWLICQEDIAEDFVEQPSCEMI